MIIVNSLKEIADEFVLTIGNFDGVHLGHQEIFKKIKVYCEEHKLKLCVMTFVPHPTQILAPKKYYLINTYAERKSLLEANQVDYLIEIDFNRDFSTMTAQAFIDGHILGNPKLKKFFVGHDFAFGANKSGDYNFINDYCSKKKLSVEILKRYDHESKVVSSSMIRKEILEGNIGLANDYLGREFFVRGRVVKGAGRGRKIGIPTANLDFDADRIIPKRGVYMSQIKMNNQKWFSVTNIGFNPTFTNDKVLNVETHILDFDNDIYGDEIEVQFYSRIRDEKKFDSVNSLLTQIQNDIKYVREKIKND